MKKKVSGWMESCIVGGPGVAGVFLGVVMARVIGIIVVCSRVFCEA